ncbi:hypothetical protein AGABI1DRAFT_54991 [Agaricus bisporus var. burnettii JB137-S8]|uniref:Transcriptional regulator of RNA polII, SAGA, subunit-domain-containing protein n=2 Tax=Agaricus bisporus var. burnettii TaxID=192524 RepID=K5Y219_AGABU|nr:uncharacterized protein AGABI1DRAFT_54991 [Agaricus bisporus var. burnettii JB137-S8]EKM81885.1 hypothetical protein AGABI1DRAFT_54991 [Agaricus bisporus var. burnettii JB137-S8]KAF7770560.1 hypothetical protein Agabi119p4_6534 [Agaricus bisporus var. burnettii]
MSLSSTSTIKQQLTQALGAAKAPNYFAALQAFVKGQLSRAEFEHVVCALLDVPALVQLHNALIISLFDATAVLRRPPTPPPPPAPKQPPTKRRRVLLPYQGPTTPDDARSFRSSRVKRWALTVGRKERDRLRNVVPFQDPQPKPDSDEIARERGVVLLPERGDPPGSRLVVNLHSASRAPTFQHIVDRVNLICAQNNLGTPHRSVPELVNMACQAKLKQLITHALTLTSTSHAITSIVPSSTLSASHSLHTHHHPQRAPVLTAASFQTLFTISPSDLPNKSASAMRLATLGPPDEDDPEDAVVLKDREIHDQRWQLMALLGERSTVRESLRGSR